MFFEQHISAFKTINKKEASVSFLFMEGYKKFWPIWSIFAKFAKIKNLNAIS